MKKKAELGADERELEILKAVAQAWHGRNSCASKLTNNEFDAHRRNFKSQPSRFRLEAMTKSSSFSSSLLKSTSIAKWDFKQSLWDSYEIVTVSKRLETGLVLDNPFSGLPEPGRLRRRRTESKNSLRNLFNRCSSRRFIQADVPDKDDTQI